MVVIPDRLSELARKGEVTDRYYNPGDLFREVHMVMVNDDRPDPADVQPMAGSAKLHLHNIRSGRGLFPRSLAWRPRLLRRWAAHAVALAQAIDPQLIRCHGVGLHSFLAAEVRRQLGVPLVISLHGNPDIDYLRGRLGETFWLRVRGRAIEAVEVASVRAADLVLPVYSPIVPYLEKHGIARFEVVYSVVGQGAIPKASYLIDKSRVRALCVGRQQPNQKDASSIIDAVAELPQVELLVVGDGDLHGPLVERAARSGAAERVRFVTSMSNREVLREMASADVYVYSSVNYEISKTCMEAALVGLPIVVNDRGGQLADELVGGHMYLVDGTKDGYKAALARIIDDDGLRERLGRAARERALADWAPEIVEARLVEIYRALLATRAGSEPCR